jgi:hypothetical protein
MKRRIGAAAGLALALGASGCAWVPSPPAWIPTWLGGGVLAAAPADPSFGVEVVDGAAVVEFHGRAANFYGRLAHRRFNQIGTFRDDVLREYFRTERAFSDYYADFAQELDDAHVDRNEPSGLEVLEFRFEGPGEARVKVRIAGANGLPLRPGSVDLEREDRWERVGGTWWIVPGRL